MSRITKEIAEQVAIKMTSKKFEEIQKVDKKLKETLTDYLVETINIEVFNFNDKFPNYINTINFARLSGNGWNYQNVTLTKSLPLKTADFMPNAEQSKTLMKLHNEINELTKARNELKNKIKVALYSLRTYSKVAIEFPEAVPFLPKKQETSLAININDIRSEL